MGFRILKRKTGWRLLHRVDRGTSTEERLVPEQELVQYGLTYSMPIERAKEALAAIRQDEKAKRATEKQARAAAKQKTISSSPWLPQALVLEFERTILPEARMELGRWNITKEIIEKLALPPNEWHWRPQAIYAQLESKGASPDYAKRLRRYLNKWGAFYCQRKRLPFLPIEKPDRTISLRLIKASRKKRGDMSTRPLLLKDLATARYSQNTRQYNGLSIMFWYFLRPRELEMMVSKPERWRVQKDDFRFKAVLHVYQEKLEEMGFAPHICWKAIPAVEPEQIALIEILEKKDFEMPNMRALKAQEINVNFRSARNGAVALLQHLGYSAACISRWLGHVRKETAQRHYESKQIAYYEPPIKKVS